MIVERPQTKESTKKGEKSFSEQDQENASMARLIHGLHYRLAAEGQNGSRAVYMDVIDGTMRIL
jgi:hypothetical protein